MQHALGADDAHGNCRPGRHAHCAGCMRLVLVQLAVCAPLKQHEIIHERATRVEVGDTCVHGPLNSMSNLDSAQMSRFLHHNWLAHCCSDEGCLTQQKKYQYSTSGHSHNRAQVGQSLVIKLQAAAHKHTLQHDGIKAVS